MSLRRYPEYKDSGVPWIGRIPAGWSVLPLISIASERTESNVGMSEDNLLSLSYGRIVRKDIQTNDGLLPESFETYQIIRPGDVVLRLTDLQNDKRSLRSALVEERGIITSAYLAIQPTKIETRFLAYLLRAYDLTKVFYSMGGGLRQSMKFTDMKRMPMVIPSDEEQTDIAAFLDLETGKIDALISEQEKLLTLLAEKRQATISHVVTRGLNPDAPMKDSGLAWLGEVPAHWDVLRIKRVITSIEQGWSPQCENFPVEGVQEWGVMKVGCVNGGVFDASENKKLPSELAPIPEYSLRKGDLLISRANTRELVGSSAVVPDDFENLLLCDKLYRIRTNLEACMPDFLAAFLSIPVARAQIELKATGASSSMLNIAQSVILELSVPFPDVTEQSAIMEFISAEINKLDNLKAGAERTIDLLTERRSALITAAVTGKIDVRDAVPQGLAA